MASKASPVATTTSGTVRGRLHHGVIQFAGVPYAAAPAGSGRFRPPQPVEPWSGIREAADFGPVSWQAQGAMASLLGSSELHCDEDCLTLNVQTQALDDGGRPVMVWIHGGGFDSGTGSTPWYDGSSFVTRGDVVVVSINYRLGALGFVHLGGPHGLGSEYASSGLSGILDQVAALRWVRDNIAAFGGDPGNVTIFGESAGAMSIGTLLGLPGAQGLFHRAVAQSGACNNVHTAERADELAAALIAELGTTDAEILLSADPLTILDAQVKVGAALGRGGSGTAGGLGSAGGSGGSSGARGSGGSAIQLPWQPVVDGVELPAPPLDAVRQGLSAHVPVLVGTTADEWNLFAIASGPVADEGALVRRLERAAAGRPGFPEPDEVIATYRAGRPEATPNELFNAVCTDLVFRMPAVRLLEAQSAHQPDGAFQYLFSWRSRAFGGALGSCHALEIPFVFNTAGAPGAEMFLGVTPDVDSVADLALTMQDAWLAFARTGLPLHPELADRVGEWPAFDRGRRAVMEFGDHVSVVDDPAGAERRLWEVDDPAPVSG
jgi:para-nitrobenzyl esterase